MDFIKVFAPLGEALGPVLGGALAGPAGAQVGGVLGRAVSELLGVAPEALSTVPRADLERATRDVASSPDLQTQIVALLNAQVQRAASNDAVEAEKGFGAWQMRRTITTYLVLAMLGTSFFANLLAALGLLRGDLVALGGLVTIAATLFGGWNGLISGGRAATDFARAWKGGA